MHVTPEPLRVMDLPRHLTFGYARPDTPPHVTAVTGPERLALCDPPLPLTPGWALDTDPLCLNCAALAQP
ncbi:hypothetical protein [Kitasatospora sp. NPDC058046]|uniref:hypothetical protein n=1 Tax=Kitasatospora sp. NPDC058046 TaxID=3346312 RepID=UPI0036DB61E5